MSNPKYLSIDEFISRIGEAEADQLAGTGMRDSRMIDREKMAAELIHADGVIDGYVRARYPRVFIIVPEVLKGIAHDIARYRLRLVGGQQSSMAEAVKTSFDEAMRLLRDIADGRLVLDSNNDGATDAHASNLVRTHNPPDRMMQALDGYLP